MTIPKLLVMSFIASILIMMPITSMATVSPASHSETVPSTGGSFDVTKTVTTGAIPANPDIYLLTDTTGSMGGTLVSVKASMSSILSAIQTAEPTAQIAVGEYRDFGDIFVHRTTQVMTTSAAAVTAEVNALGASGGGNFPEAQLFALNTVATDPGIGFRSGSSSIIVWFGDARGHDPSGGINEERRARSSSSPAPTRASISWK